MSESQFNLKTLFAEKGKHGLMNLFKYAEWTGVRNIARVNLSRDYAFCPFEAIK